MDHSFSVSVHPYWTYPRHYELCNEWWQARHAGVFPEELVPTDEAAIAEVDGEPMAFLVMYMIYGVGIAHLEWPITKPGMGMKATAALRGLVEHMKTIARSRDYGLLRTTTFPRFAKALQREGWMLEDREPRIPLLLKI